MDEFALGLLVAAILCGMFCVSLWTMNKRIEHLCKLVEYLASAGHDTPPPASGTSVTVFTVDGGQR